MRADLAITTHNRVISANFAVVVCGQVCAITTHNRVISAKLPLTRPAATLPQGEGLFIGFLSLHRPEPDFFAGLILQIGLAL